MTVSKVSCPTWLSAVAPSWSVISTSWFGSAPWSPEPLTVEVDAHSVTVPSRWTSPVSPRSPSVAGAHGRPVPPSVVLSPVGYWLRAPSGCTA